jgi:iron complex transport system permease protein
MKSLSRKTRLVLLALTAVYVIYVMPFWGPHKIALQQIWEKGNTSYDIFWQMRFPRVLMGFCAGSIFALGGVVFQALFRNPLVSPFTLGVTSGASFGAAMYIFLGLSFTILGLSGISLFAFLGALLSVWIVWRLAKIKRVVSTNTILLAGVAVSFFFSSLIMFIQYLSGVAQSFKISRWLMGGFFTFGYSDVLNILPFTIVGFLAIWFFSHELNLLTTGDDLAKSRGVDTARTSRFLIVLISFLIGGVVAVCGPIAFIGIIVPHMCRIFIGTDHRYLTLASFLFGGIFLVVCDGIARVVIAPAEMPVGIITALIGGPFFVWLLVSRSSDEAVSF